MPIETEESVPAAHSDDLTIPQKSHEPSPSAAEQKNALSPSPSNEEDSALKKMLANMSLEEKVGQLFNVRLNEEDLDMIARLHLGGATLFPGNVRTAEQVRSLIADMQSRASVPLFVSIDEEGGRISKLNKLGGDYADASSIGEGKDPAKAYDQAKRAGEELKGLGFNMDFAPVADIWSNPENTVIGDRAYGTTPADVSPMVEAAVRGFAEAGILSVIKHFPGHGDTAEDSHLERAVYKHGWERLESFELAPFKAGIAAGADGVMVGHIALPEIAGSNVPADFQPELLNDVLRQQLGFTGLIITDALDMGGITEEFGPAEAALKAFEAGADVLLLSVDPDDAFAAVLGACENNGDLRKRLDESVLKILAAKEKAGVWE